MSNSNGGQGDEVLSTYVTVGANLAPLDQSMAQLPARMTAKIAEAEQKIRAQMARNALKIKDFSALANNAGEADIVREAAAAQVDKYRQAQAALRAELERVRQPIDRLAAANARLAAEQNSLTAVAKRAAAAQSQLALTTRTVTTAQAGVSGSTRNNAMGFLMLSQAIEDAQYGFSGVVNNIPGIVMAMGGSGGLAGTVSLVAIGINQLVKHWDEVAKLWRSDATIKQVEQMKKLAEWTKKVTDETKRLSEIKPGSVQEGQKQVEEALNKVGYTQALADVQAAVKASGRGGTDEMNKATAEKLLARSTLGDKAAIEYLQELMVSAGKTLTSSPGRRSAFGNAMADTPFGEKTPQQIAAEHEARRLNMLGNADAADEKKRREKLAEAEEQRVKDAEALDDKAKAQAENFKGRYGAALLDTNERGAVGNQDIEAKIKSDLEKSGSSPEEAAQLAGRIVTELLKEFEQKVSERSRVEGTSREAAADREKRIMAEDEKARSKALMKKLGDDFKPQITDVAGYLNKLQTAGIKDSDPLLTEAKKQTKIQEQIRDKKPPKARAEFGPGTTDRP